MAATLGWTYLALVVAGAVAYRLLRRRGVPAERISAAFGGTFMLLGVSAATAYSDTVLGPKLCEFGPAVSADFAMYAVVAQGAPVPDLTELAATCTAAAQRQTAVAVAMIVGAVALAVVATVRATRASEVRGAL